MGELNKWSIITFTNRDTDGKYFKNVHKILLDCICDTMNLLVEVVNFGDLLTDGKAVDGYYTV